MAGILDSLVTHLESRIVSGDSRERVSAEVLNEFMSDVANAPAQTAPSPHVDIPKKDAELKVPEPEAVLSPEPIAEAKVEPAPEPVSTPEPVEEEPKAEAGFTPTYSEGEKPAPVVITKEVEGLSLDDLRIHGNSCSACNFNLGEKRSKETGLNPSAKLMIITEPSGRTEEHMLDPFYEEAGDLFLKMVGAMKIDLDDLYICMAHKCFGPGAREKIVETKPFLEKQIELVKPQVILIFGGAALNILLGEQSLMKNRGKWLDLNGIPTIATFPPAYLQQKAEAKREAWNDLQQVMARLK